MSSIHSLISIGPVMSRDRGSSCPFRTLLGDARQRFRVLRRGARARASETFRFLARRRARRTTARVVLEWEATRVASDISFRHRARALATAGRHGLVRARHLRDDVPSPQGERVRRQLVRDPRVVWDERHLHARPRSRGGGRREGCGGAEARVRRRTRRRPTRRERETGCERRRRQRGGATSDATPPASPPTSSREMCWTTPTPRARPLLSPARACAACAVRRRLGTI